MQFGNNLVAIMYTLKIQLIENLYALSNLILFKFIFQDFLQKTFLQILLNLISKYQSIYFIL